MARARTVHRCSECGAPSPKWVGRCPTCEAWGTLVEEVEEAPAASIGRPRVSAPSEAPRPITDALVGSWEPVPTGIPELDRVLGGGLVPGSISLVGGEPGIGKSTLLLEAAAAMARAGARTLYVSAEESRSQVRARAERLGALVPELWLAAETSVIDVVASMGSIAPVLVVVDSIQTVHDPEVGSSPGSVTQVRGSTHRLAAAARATGAAVVLVGHVTKDGSLAGPRVLEHVVDTVLSFEGDRHHALRMLRAVKHRFGATSELGLFEMTGTGLVGVADASGMFLADRRPGVPGSIVVPTLDGHRPMLVEVQALVAESPLAMPRRSAQGIDGGRLSMLLAVLERRAGVSVAGNDVFVSAVGGVDIDEPGADLGVALAVASAHAGHALPDDLVAYAEVGLGGELRQVAETPRRLAEAARLGFRRAIVAASAPGCDGLQVERATTLAEALLLAGSHRVTSTGTAYSRPRPAIDRGPGVVVGP